MLMSIRTWNKKVANQDIVVVGKRFWYKGEWYRYELTKQWVRITKDK